MATGKLKDPEVTTKLAAALTRHDLSEALLSVAAAVEGSAAVVYLVDRRGELRLQASRGAARWAQSFPVLPLEAPVPLAEAIASRIEMFLETRAALEEHDPATANMETRFQAEAVLPLLADGRLLGAFAIMFDRARQFEDDERHWLTGIAVQAGLAANRVRLFHDLTQAVRLNELFVGVVAHDLRQPVNAVSVSAALLQSREGKDGAVDPRGSRARSRILKSTARISGMIDHLLDFTRLRMGAGLPLTLATSELTTLAAQIAEEVRDGRPDKVVTVDGFGDTRGSWDADRLGQMLSNLIGNAVQHGAESAGVRVVIDGTDADAVRVRVHNMGAIAADLVPKLFEPLTAGERRRDGVGGPGARARALHSEGDRRGARRRADGDVKRIRWNDVHGVAAAVFCGGG
jgi:signal transduction histidine kinase